ncbi:MAG: hypothetical protein J6D20_03835 [Clostridia bacterium]|nr:hypothetical protein [Clostridia bacterium]
MAEKREKPIVGKVGADNKADLAARLNAASGNIERVSADTVARQTEQKKNLKKSESDARARARGSEKQLVADNKRRDDEAARRLAELEYAEDYRKKLQRDRKRAMAEAKEAKEAAEAKAREERSRQIAEMLEQERREARERGERADALLRMLARRDASEVTEEAPEQRSTTESASEDTANSFEPSEAAANEEISDAVAEAVVDSAVNEDNEYAENTVSEESEEAAPPAAESYSEAIASYEEPVAEAEQTEKIIIDVKDDRLLLNIGPDGSFYSIEDPKAEGSKTEQREEVVGEYPDPKLSSDPVVAAIQTLGKSVYSTSTYRKYVDKSRAAIKEFKRISADAAQNASIGSIDEGAAGAAMVQSIKAAGRIVEIRCDNLRLASKFGQKSVGDISDELHKDIDRYNSRASEFTAYTGERLTRISTALPARIADGTGLEVVPELTYDERYIEYNGEYSGERTRSYVITIGSQDEEPSVTRERSKGVSGTYIVNPIIPELTAEELLRGTYVYDTESYESYRYVVKNAGRAIERAIKDISRGISLAERENTKLAGRLEYHRKSIEKLLENMQLKIDDAKDVMFRKTLAVLEGKRAKYERDEKKLELNRTYIEDENRKRSITVSTFALRREKLLLAFNTLSASTVSDKAEYVEKAKAELIAEMGLYNKAAEDCSVAIGIPVSPVSASLADEIIEGKTCVDIPRIAILKELVETVGEESRVIGRCENTSGAATCTFVIKGQQSEKSEKTVGGVKRRSGIKTVHGHFFIGGTASNGGALSGDAGCADALVTGAILAGPMISAGGGDGVDPGAAAATALAFGTAARASGFPSVISAASDNGAVGSSTEDIGYDATPETVETAPESVAVPEAVSAAALTAQPAIASEAASVAEAAPVEEVAPIADVEPIADITPASEAAPDGSEFAFTPGVFGFENQPEDTEELLSAVPEENIEISEAANEASIPENFEAPALEESVIEETPIIEDIQPLEEFADEAAVEESFSAMPEQAPSFNIEKTDDSSFDIADEADVAFDNAETQEPTDISEAPIEEISPKKLVKTVRNADGGETVSEEPYTEELVDDGDGFDSEQSGEEVSDEMYSGLEPVDMTGGDETAKGKKLKLVQLPPPEGADGAQDAEQGELTDDGMGPVYPGNMIEHSDSDKYADPDDLSSLPDVIEIDDSADITEGDVLTNPTKRGLKKHLAYISRKVKRAEHERSRLIRLKRAEKSVVPKVKYIISILGIQKEIIDWYCNALSSACDVGVKKKIRKIATRLRSELKRYNKFVKEYEHITDDRLTRASLEIPACIIDGEDYPIIPKVKLREFEAPENGVVYEDGITEIADVDVDFSDNVIMTEKDLKRRLRESSRELARLHNELDRKSRDKHNAWGIDKSVLVAECFAIEKKIIDNLAADLHAACQVSAVKDIQSVKKDLAYEIKQYNRLVSEYRAATGNVLTPASDSIPQDIIAGKLYSPIAKVGCIHNADDDLEAEIGLMSRNTYGVEDDDISEAGRAAFRSNVIAQANKDFTFITRRADYRISMLESERDMLEYRFGKESSQVKREKKAITKLIEQIKAEHKAALRYENSDNRRYYAAVTANPRTMTLRNRRADRTRIAALRSRIISLLNERDLINGKLMALYGGEGEGTLGSINQTFRRVKNNAAAKSKKKQKSLAKVVKSLPITVKDKERFYDLMNKKVDAESTIAFVKYRMKKGKLHKADMLCAKRDIKELKAKVSRIEKDIKDLMKSVKQRISEVESGSTWLVAFMFVLVLIAAGIALYVYFFGDSITQMLNIFSS